MKEPFRPNGLSWSYGLGVLALALMAVPQVVRVLPGCSGDMLRAITVGQAWYGGYVGMLTGLTKSAEHPSVRERTQEPGWGCSGLCGWLSKFLSLFGSLV